ncbi:MAG TPA: hypothetical protein VLE74_04330 [Candidatus Saccharimonadales bacterium]|nr:hypothetical protein [Candidatus Saccharimonadales bacterium]
MTPAYILSFLVMGLWLALKAHKKNLLPVEFLFIGSLAASLVVYYFVFYIYIASPAVAHAVVLMLLLASLPLLFLIVNGARRSKQVLKTIRTYYVVPLLITTVFLVVYSLIFYSCVAKKPALGGYGEIDNRTFCHTSALPFDNALPFIYGQNILNKEERKPVIDWSLADRPPLQIAAALPILDFSQHHTQYKKFFEYNIFSVFLQLSWVGAIWGVMQSLKIKKKYQAAILIGLGTTGFFYLNSVFVWPKLLAAGLVFSGVILFLGKPRHKIEYRYFPFAAITLSLGMLSHTGVLFTIVPFALLMAYKIARSRKINIRYTALSLALALSLLLPWYVYKGTLVKADRLVKWHFAGVQDLDQRGTVKTIVSQYRKLSFHDWLDAKEKNVKTLATGNFSSQVSCPIGTSVLVNKCAFDQWRTMVFFSTVFALEAFNLGWLAFAYRIVRKKLDSLDIDILIVIGLSLVFWVLAMFMPASTVVHQGSYATMMLLFFFLAKNLADLPFPVIASVVAVQPVIFYLVWIAAFFKLS